MVHFLMSIESDRYPYQKQIVLEKWEIRYCAPSLERSAPSCCGVSSLHDGGDPTIHPNLFPKNAYRRSFCNCSALATAGRKRDRWTLWSIPPLSMESGLSLSVEEAGDCRNLFGTLVEPSNPALIAFAPPAPSTSCEYFRPLTK